MEKIGPQAILLMPLKDLTGSIMVLCDLTGSSKRPSIKADLIYSSFVTVSGQCMSVAIILSNKMDFDSCACMEGFHKSSHK